MKFAITLLSILINQNALGDAMLRIRPHVVVSPHLQVTLQQLVDGQGLSADFMTKLSSVAVTMAPALGEKQELASAHLTGVLRPLIQAERKRNSNRLIVVIPKSVVIDTVKRTLTTELVNAELMQAWQPLCTECQLEVEGMAIPRIDTIRDWSLRLKPELPRGSFSVPVQITRENGATTSAWVTGRLIVKRKVPVAKRVLNINERIGEQDFTWEFRDTSYAIDGVPSAEELIGKRVKQGLRVNDVLWKNLLERERAIRAGEMVQLKSSSGAWEVTMGMVAQQDAFIGDVINLRNPKSNNILMGHVVGRGEVELR